jgi:hypothetical protein
VTPALFEYHSVIGYRFTPEMVAHVQHENGGYLVRCNGSGFRCDHEVTVRRPSGTFRAIVFGDSYTAGDGISNGKRYSDLLEARLPGSEVLNFGLPGSGTDQQFLVFHEFACQIEYDLLILSPMVTNIWRILVGEQLTMSAMDQRIVKRAKPYFRLVDGLLRLKNQPVPREVRPVDPDELDDDPGIGPLKRLARNMIRCWPALLCLSQRLRDIRCPVEYDDPNGHAWRLMKAILVAWIRQSRAPVLLYPIPSFVHINKCMSSDGYLSRFAELCDEERVELVNALPEFWKLPAAQRKRCRYPTDDHPTELGHKVLAEALYPHVRNHYANWKYHNIYI